MAAKVRLEWTNPANTGQFTQTVQSRLNDEVDWTDILYDASFTKDPRTGIYTYEDTNISFGEETIVHYRVMTSNGTYALPSNEFSITVGGAVTPVTDLSGEVVVEQSHPLE